MMGIIVKKEKSFSGAEALTGRDIGMQPGGWVLHLTQATVRNFSSSSEVYLGPAFGNKEDADMARKRLMQKVPINWDTCTIEEVDIAVNATFPEKDEFEQFIIEHCRF